MEEFGVQFHYIKGNENTMADALSRLPLREINRGAVPGAVPSASSINEAPTMEAAPKAAINDANTQDDTASVQGIDTFNNYFSMAIYHEDLLDCFVNLPTLEEIPFVLDYNRVREEQLGDAQLQTLMQKNLMLSWCSLLHQILK